MTGTNKAFFMPYDPNHTGYMNTQFEYGGSVGMNKLQIDVDHELSKGNTAVPVWYKPKTKSAFIGSLNTGQIYIRGHGMPGFRSIEGGRGGERVRVEVVCDRLIESGLRKTFNGKLKMFNCHSAEEGEVGTDPEVVGPAFAQQVADEMFSRGYKSCTFYGYIGSIDSFVKDGSQGKRHYVREKQRVGNRTVQVELARASELRVQFRPRVKVRKGFFGKLFG